jgi:hypothetical protein
MERETKNRLGIAALIYSMTNAVIFGAGIITVLNLPSLRSNAWIWIPVIVAASLVLAAPAAWLIAPAARALPTGWLGLLSTIAAPPART